MRTVAKAAKLKIIRTSSAEDRAEFYRLLGPFFCSAEVRRELGTPITSDDSYAWFVALDGEAVAGWTSLHWSADRKTARLGDSYVCPPYRRRKLYTALFEAREKEAEVSGVTSVHGVANECSLPVFERHGFRVVKYRGKYPYVAKELL